MNRQFNQVKEFHAACSVEMPDKPTLLSGGDDNVNSITGKHLERTCEVMKIRQKGGDLEKRASYMLEELAEFMQAETIEDQADALIDLIYFAVGTFTLMGIKPEPIFDLVQAANMRKVVDGKVLRNEQGKIVKPDGWYGPEKEIKAEIKNQKMNAYYAQCGITEDHLAEIRKMQQEGKKME